MALSIPPGINHQRYQPGNSRQLGGINKSTRRTPPTFTPPHNLPSTTKCNQQGIMCLPMAQHQRHQCHQRHQYHLHSPSTSLQQLSTNSTYLTTSNAFSFGLHLGLSFMHLRSYGRLSSVPYSMLAPVPAQPSRQMTLILKLQ